MKYLIFLTIFAAMDLIKKAGGNIGGIASVIELEFLNAREKLKNIPILSLIKYKK